MPEKKHSSDKRAEAQGSQASQSADASQRRSANKEFDKLASTVRDLKETTIRRLNKELRSLEQSTPDKRKDGKEDVRAERRERLEALKEEASGAYARLENDISETKARQERQADVFEPAKNEAAPGKARADFELSASQGREVDELAARVREEQAELSAKVDERQGIGRREGEVRSVDGAGKAAGEQRAAARDKARGPERSEDRFEEAKAPEPARKTAEPEAKRTRSPEVDRLRGAVDARRDEAVKAVSDAMRQFESDRSQRAAAQKGSGPERAQAESQDAAKRKGLEEAADVARRTFAGHDKAIQEAAAAKNPSPGDLQKLDARIRDEGARVKEQIDAAIERADAGPRKTPELSRLQSAVDSRREETNKVLSRAMRQLESAEATRAASQKSAGPELAEADRQGASKRQSLQDAAELARRTFAGHDQSIQQAASAKTQTAAEAQKLDDRMRDEAGRVKAQVDAAIQRAVGAQRYSANDKAADEAKPRRLESREEVRNAPVMDEKRQRELEAGASAALEAKKLNNNDRSAKPQVERLLRENKDNPAAMMEFYKRVEWDGARKLAGRLDDADAKLLDKARVLAVRQAWEEVKAKFEQQYGVRFADPWVGSAPDIVVDRDKNSSYKYAKSDIDLSLRIEKSRDIIEADKILIETKAMQAMQDRLKGLVPSPAEQLDSNVYMRPLALPLRKDEAADKRLAQFASSMAPYEVRLRCAHDDATWRRFTEKALEGATRQGKEQGLRVQLADAQRRFVNLSGERERATMALLDARKAANLDSTSTEARREVAREVEMRLRRAIEDRLTKIVVEAGADLMKQNERGEDLRAQALMLQLELRTVWPEVYVGDPAVRLGVTKRAEVPRVLNEMSTEDLARARVSEAAFMLEWLARDESNAMKLWKIAKYQMRETEQALAQLRKEGEGIDKESLQRLYIAMEQGLLAWKLEGCNELRQAPDESVAWDTWVKRSKGDRKLAEDRAEAALRAIRMEAEEYLANYFATNSRANPPVASTQTAETI